MPYRHLDAAAIARTIERLCRRVGLSRKIWQKLSILYAMGSELPVPPAAAGA